MFSPVSELKTRARLLLNSLRSNSPAVILRSTRIAKQQGWCLPDEWSLRHALNIVASEAGFIHWEHARQMLEGNAPAPQDMGTFWYDKQAHGFTNHWFASYTEATAQLRLHPDSYLLPYKNQFFIAELPCIEQLGLGAQPALWQAISHDLAAAYGTAAWYALCELRFKATRTEILPTPADSQTDAHAEDISEPEFSRRVLDTFVENGRLNKIPQMRKKRLVVLQWLVAQLERGRRYEEKEINTFLLQFHEDFATLRREFIACKLMARDNAVYWRC